MRRFLKSSAVDAKYGVGLCDIECESTKLQLNDEEIQIGDEAIHSMMSLPKEEKKLVLLGIRAFYMSAITYLQKTLPLGNNLLRALGCLNPNKKAAKSNLASIQTLSRALQPKLDLSLIVDEWKLYQAD